jgi:hypothetical protein
LLQIKGATPAQIDEAASEVFGEIKTILKQFGIDLDE